MRKSPTPHQNNILYTTTPTTTIIINFSHYLPPPQKKKKNFQMDGWNSTHQVAFFPGVLEKARDTAQKYAQAWLCRSGIFMAFSTGDLLTWSEPRS